MAWFTGTRSLNWGQQQAAQQRAAQQAANRANQQMAAQKSAQQRATQAAQQRAAAAAQPQYITKTVTTPAPAAAPFLTPTQIQGLTNAFHTYQNNLAAQQMRIGEASAALKTNLANAKLSADHSTLNTNQALSARGLGFSSIHDGALADINRTLTLNNAKFNTDYQNVYNDAMRMTNNLNQGWGDTQAMADAQKIQNAQSVPPAQPTVTQVTTPNPAYQPPAPYKPPAPAAKAPSGIMTKSPNVPGSMYKGGQMGAFTWGNIGTMGKQFGPPGIGK
jgi:hypothetical protein